MFVKMLLNDILNRAKGVLGNKSLMNGALFSMFSFINRGFGFLLLLILANYITPSEYGYLSLFSTVTMVISYFMAMSTEGYISIAYFKEGKIGLKQTVTGIFFTTSIVITIFLFALFCFADIISKLLDLQATILLLGIIIYFFTVYTNILLDYFRIQRKLAYYGLFSCGNAFLNFLMSILLVKYLSYEWEGRVYANFICVFLFGSFAIIVFIKNKLITAPSWKHLRTVIIWGLPIIPHLATTFVRQGCDRYIINYFHSIEDVGLFSFALTLSNIIMMVGSGFNQSNSVDIYDTLSNNNWDNGQKLQKLTSQKSQITKIYIYTSLLIMISGYITTPLILPKYSGAMNYFLVLSVYGFIYCIYFLYANFLFYYKKTKVLMYITFVSSVSHLLLSLALTRYSLYYTCFIYCIVQLAIVCTVRHIANSLIKENLKQL